jgi:type I restriction enzyme S subunit
MARLGDVCEINPRAPKDIADETVVSFLPMSAVSEGGFVSTEEMRAYKDVKKGYTYFERGDVLIAKITPCFENGKAALADKISSQLGFGSTEFHVVRPSPDVDAKYVFYLLWNDKFRAVAEKGMTGSAGQKRVPADLLKRFELPLPPLDEQKRIAAILDKADQLRQKRRHAIALLDSLTQSVFLEMFGNVIENDKLLPFGEISDWVANFETGKNLAPDPDNSDPLSYRVLKVSAVTSGIFKPKEAKALPKKYTPPPSHIVKKGDLLFSRANTAELIGATAIVNGDYSRIVLPDKIWRFVWNVKKQPNSVFMHGLFSSSAFREEISKRASGTSGSMKNISKAKVLSIRVGQPDRFTQDKYAERIEAANGCRLRCINQLSIFEAQFASLQHRAFTGQL